VNQTVTSSIHSADDNLCVNDVFFLNKEGTGWTDSNFLSFPTANHSPTDAVRCWKTSAAGDLYECR
jgi:hypothetical protein